ncbi:protein-L-isoaspartate O-methyltransferase family protein [Limnochorda pilosa]|uniref:protein-L-isoaspartate O-methyltransferase family protein n=1 Tax=Limnochorda pilosa TaxID=1555112 RepID=UPI00130E6282|nr:methyltransferase domain-containing protein [Limnochorda pilosa]
MRRRLAAWLRSEGYTSDPRIVAAFAAVPRHWFLRSFYLPGDPSFAPVRFDPADPDPDLLRAVYTNQALVTRLEKGVPVSSSSEPAVMAVMLEALAAAPGERVLEVGTGTGYNAALLAFLVGVEGRVVSLDISEAVASEAAGALQEGGFHQVEVHAADGRAGWPGQAPYDRIIVTAASRLHRAWVGQLRDGGTLVLPFAVEPGSAPILGLRREGVRLHGRFGLYAHFMPLRGDPVCCRRGAALPLTPASQPGLDGTDLADLWDIGLFLALELPRSFAWVLAPDGLRVPAIRTEGGTAAWAPGALLTAGRRPPVQTLAWLLERWTRLGRPRLGDYVAEAWVGRPPPAPPARMWLLPGDPAISLHLA